MQFSYTESRILQNYCQTCNFQFDVISKRTRPDRRQKMRLVCVLFTFENNAGLTDLRTYGPTDPWPYGPTDGRTDTTFYRDATAYLKSIMIKDNGSIFIEK